VSARRITLPPADLAAGAAARRDALVRAPMAGARFRAALEGCSDAALEEAAMLTVATAPWRARAIGAELRRRRQP